MTLGGLALAGGWIAPAVGQAFAWLAWPLLAYTLKVVEAVGAIPGLVVYIQTGWGFAAAYYILLAFFTAIYPRLGNWKPKVKPVAVLLILGLAAALLWRLVAERPDGKLTLTLIPNPDGPAVLIRLPGGDYLLVNGGSSSRELSAALETWLPPTRQRLAGVFLTTAKNTNLKGLPDALERWRPDLLYWPEEAATSSAGRDISERLGIRRASLQSGQVFDLGAGVSLTILAASPEEAALLLSYGEFQALLSSGVGISAYQRQPQGLDYLLLTPAGLESDQLQGFRLLDGLASPQTPAGEDAPYLVQAQTGWIKIVTDGRQAWLSRQP
jgi:hypothetical protein